MPTAAPATPKAEPARTATMRAAVFVGDGAVRVERRARPEVQAGQVRVRMAGCGVCASNLPVFEGRSWFDYPQAPGAPGHEGWGHVDAVGEGVEALAPGDPVAVLSYHAFAEYDVAPAAQVVRLPEALAGRPFPAEPLGCAVNVFRRSDVQAGQAVAIVGVGFLGALLAQLAASAGARVVALSRRAFALEAARRCGAAHAVRLEDDDAALEQVRDWNGGALCDRVIEATGKEAPLNLAARLTRVRGRLVVAGFHQDGPREVDMQLWNWRGLDVINAHERDAAVYVDGIRAAVGLVEEGRLDPAPLLTHAVPLGRLGEALRLMQERPDGFLKAWVRIED